MTKILVFDTETNGLPISWQADVSDISNWPRVIELAWELFDGTGKTITKRSSMVIPDGWTLPKDGFWEEHGYDMETLALEGELMPDVLNSFLASVQLADVMVAHNMSFDYPVINCEMLRYGKRAKRVKTYCTKLESADICGIKDGHGQNKWPTLGEAYAFFTGKEPLGAHHAAADVQMCKEVYLHLQKPIGVGHVTP